MGTGPLVSVCFDGAAGGVAVADIDVLTPDYINPCLVDNSAHASLPSDTTLGKTCG